MKEFLKKSWSVTRIEVFLLGYLLISLPRVMWKIAQVTFEQEDMNLDAIFQKVSEELEKI